MRIKEYDFDPAAASLTGFASNVTGAAFTLTANSSGDGLAHQVSIRNDSATDHSAKTVTLVGTDPNGAALTEVVTGPDTSATVESAGYFLTLTSATPSATIGADTFDIGWVDEFASKTIPLDAHSAKAALIGIKVTGTIDYTVEQATNNVLTAGKTPNWLAISALSAKTASLHVSADVGATAIRLICNSYTDTAEIQMNVNQ
jgi:hypothetical protein